MFKMGDYLIHYGVKGMKWGVRRYQPYSVRGRLGGRAGRYLGQYKPNTRNSSSSARSTRSVRQSNAKKVLKGAAIVAGSAVVAVGAYKMSKYFKTPEGRRKLNKGVEWTKEKLINANYNTHNAVRVIRTATRVPRTALKALPGGKAAVATLGVASTVSDINTTRQWAQKTHKQGKITKSDVKDLAIDLANPLPNNLLNRKKKIAHSDVLVHYGVKGMKWGIRKDRNSLGYSKTYNKTKKHVLSDRQKRALKIGAAIIGTGLLVYGGYKVRSFTKGISYEGIFNKNKYLEELNAIKNSKGIKADAFKDLEIVNHTTISRTAKDNIFIKNTPITKVELKAYHHDIKRGRFSNCAKCTIAADMRQKGYDVVAGPSINGKGYSRFWNYYKNSVTLDVNGRPINVKPGTFTEELHFTESETNRLKRMLNGETLKEKYVVNKRWTPSQAKSKTISNMLSMGDGASGDITLHTRDMSSGHSMYFKVKDGRVRIFDYQTGLSFDAERDFYNSRYFDDLDFNTSHVTRLDNLKPDLDRMVSDRIIELRR